MLSAFDHDDYREYLRAWIKSKDERGAQQRLAEAMQVSSSLVSLILKREKELTLEQAHQFAEWIGMNERECDYWLLLVEYARAGTHALKARHARKLKELREQSKKISNRVPKDLELDEVAKSIFYSNWLYSGIRNLAAIPEYSDVPSIAARLQLPNSVVARVLEFLIQHGLCVEKDGKITYGPSLTHLAADSPLVDRHHQNWRLRGFEQMSHKREDDLFYTCPMSLSEKDAVKIRAMLPTLVEQILKIVKPSPSEKVYCINIDWFEW